MALKNLYDMVKADRYTADGREALIKAQEAETEDKVYQIGEISQKTGLQKTANGWVKPKNGGATEAKAKEDKPLQHTSASSSVQESVYKDIKNNGLEDYTVEEIAKEYKTTRGDAEAIRARLDKESKSDAASDIPDFKGMSSEDFDKKLRAEGWTTGGWEGSGTHASAIFKKGDRKIRVNEGQPGKITSIQEISKPSESKPTESKPDTMQEMRNAERPIKTAAQIITRGDLDDAIINSARDEEALQDIARDLLSPAFDAIGEDIPDNYMEFATDLIKNRYEVLEERATGDASPRVLTGDTRIRVRKA